MVYTSFLFPKSLIAFLLVIIFCLSVYGTDYYVATNGSDSNDGSLATPWQTIQHAVSSVRAGDTIFVRNGSYSERVRIEVSGSAGFGEIVLRNYPGETAILDGSSLVVPEGSSAMLTIEGQSYITVQGLEIANYRTTDRSRVVMGVFVTGASDHITLRDLNVHHIEQNSSIGGDAHGIAVYGTDGISSINNLVIAGCTVSNCVLGSSEALVLNGNVEEFLVSGNTVHDCNNIGIDLIGWEDVAPANDQARNGIVRGNTVYNITSYGNPAYGTERSAAGIYVDGGKDITIDRNTVYQCDFGLEVGCEHGGRSTSGIVVRDNLFYSNQITGIGFGGYDTKRGVVIDCTFEHNTLFENDTTRSQNGEMVIQQSHGNQIRNNLFYANSQRILISNYFKALSSYDNMFDYNLYYTDGGLDGIFILQDNEYTGLIQFQTDTGQDPHSQFADPLLANVTASTPVLIPLSGSPAIDTGDPAFVTAEGETDFSGNDRIVNGRTDCGAYEYQGIGITYTVTVTVSPEDGGTVSGSGSYIAGSKATLTANAVSGYRFFQWTGDLAGSANPIQFTVNGDMSVIAVFKAGWSKSDPIAIGSVIEITASEIDAALQQFSRKPRVYAVYDGYRRGPMRVVTSEYPAESVLAEWRKKILLYDKREFRGRLISSILIEKPMSPLVMDGIFVSVRETASGVIVVDQPLDRTLYLEPPEITAIDGTPSKEGDFFTVSGNYFGSKIPKVMIEYLKNGDPSRPAYRTCYTDFQASMIYQDARGNLDRSCMKVLSSDTTDSEPVGHSQVVAEYPWLNESDQPTGYVVIDNGIGLSVFPIQ